MLSQKRELQALPSKTRRPGAQRPGYGPSGWVIVQIDEGRDRRFRSMDGRNGKPACSVERERHVESGRLHRTRQPRSQDIAIGGRGARLHARRLCLDAPAPQAPGSELADQAVEQRERAQDERGRCRDAGGVSCLVV